VSDEDEIERESKDRFSKSMISEIKAMFESAISCVSSSSSNISWLDYGLEVLSLAFTHHRNIIISGVSKKIEEPYRPVFMPEILTLRKSLMVSFYIPKDCVDMINEIIVFSEFLLNQLVSKNISTRTAVGIARLVAFIQRNMSSDSCYISHDMLVKLLNELYTHVLAALSVLKL